MKEGKKMLQKGRKEDATMIEATNVFNLFYLRRLADLLRRRRPFHIKSPTAHSAAQDGEGCKHSNPPWVAGMRRMHVGIYAIAASTTPREAPAKVAVGRASNVD